MVDAFDAGVVIYAAIDSGRGRSVRRLFDAASAAGQLAGIGSVLLLPEVLSKPVRDEATAEYERLIDLLGMLDLVPTDAAIARLATALGASYHPRAADAIHLASAVAVGAERFITNNRKDFTTEISEIAIVYPELIDQPDAT